MTITLPCPAASTCQGTIFVTGVRLNPPLKRPYEMLVWLRRLCVRSVYHLYEDFVLTNARVHTVSSRTCLHRESPAH